MKERINASNSKCRIFRSRDTWIMISHSTNETHEVRDQTLCLTKLLDWSCVGIFSVCCFLSLQSKTDLHCWQRYVLSVMRVNSLLSLWAQDQPHWEQPALTAPWEPWIKGVVFQGSGRALRPALGQRSSVISEVNQTHVWHHLQE